VWSVVWVTETRSVHVFRSAKRGLHVQSRARGKEKLVCADYESGIFIEGHEFAKFNSTRRKVEVRAGMLSVPGMLFVRN